MVVRDEFIVWSCRRFPLAVTLKCVSDVTRILDSIQRGDPRAGEELLPLVYEELRKLAAQKLAHEPADIRGMIEAYPHDVRPHSRSRR